MLCRAAGELLWARVCEDIRHREEEGSANKGQAGRCKEGQGHWQGSGHGKEEVILVTSRALPSGGISTCTMCMCITAVQTDEGLDGCSTQVHGLCRLHHADCTCTVVHRQSCERGESDLLLNIFHCGWHALMQLGKGVSRRFMPRSRCL